MRRGKSSSELDPFVPYLEHLSTPRYKRAADAEPHAGFKILYDYATQRRFKPFVYTTQIEGLFHKAGFPGAQIVEVHGSVNHLQCLNKDCENNDVVRAEDTVGTDHGKLGIKVDRKTNEAELKVSSTSTLLSLHLTDPVQKDRASLPQLWHHNAAQRPNDRRQRVQHDPARQAKSAV